MSRSRIISLANLQQFAAVNVLSDPGHIGGKVKIPLCMQVRLNWTQQDGKIAHNVLYGATLTAPAPTVALANQLFSALSTSGAYTALKAVFSGASSFSGVSLRDMSQFDQPYIDSTGPAVAGTGVGATLPNEVAVVITLRTALVGPSGRGRMYIPNWDANSAAAGNVILAANVTLLQNWANTISGAFSASGLTWSLGLPARVGYTSPIGTVHPARDAKTVPITSAVVRNNTWDSQRRRGLK